MFGRVDEVPGVCYIATQFFHVWYIPLIPLSSMLVVDDSNPDSLRGTNIAMSGKSVLAAYLRAATMIGGLLMLGLAIYHGFSFFDELSYASRSYSSGGYYPEQSSGISYAIGSLVWAILLFLGGVGSLVTFWLSYKFMRPNEERKAQLLGDLGLSGSVDAAMAAVGPRERLLAAPDVSFQHFHSMMDQLGLQMYGAPEANPAGGDPLYAEWGSQDGSRVIYYFDPPTGLKMVEIEGQNPDYLRNDLLNMTYLPTIQGYQVSSMLASQDPNELIRGIYAAEFLGINGDQQYYIDPVGRLTAHPDTTVAQAARQIYDKLIARA